MSEIPSAGEPERSDGWSTGASPSLPQPTIAVDVPLAGQRLQRFLDELASDAATPGGGAWAGIAAACGAALIAMVARLTLKKKGFEEVAARMAAIAEECDEERHILMGLADRDAAAYRDVMAAYKLPKETPPQEHIRAFTADVPLEVARRSVYLMGLAAETIHTGNPNAASDAYSAAAALHAAAVSALANVDINAITFVDKTRQRELSDSASSLRNRAQSILREVGDAFVIAVHA
jgi:formiminotetrahydrofolate cyclodeaminase